MVLSVRHCQYHCTSRQQRANRPCRTPARSGASSPASGRSRTALSRAWRSRAYRRCKNRLVVKPRAAFLERLNRGAHEVAIEPAPVAEVAHHEAREGVGLHLAHGAQNDPLVRGHKGVPVHLAQVARVVAVLFQVAIGRARKHEISFRRSRQRFHAVAAHPHRAHRGRYLVGLFLVGCNLFGRRSQPQYAAPAQPATMPRTLPPANGSTTWPPAGLNQRYASSHMVGRKTLV
jgi:hypothetical protein